MPTDIANMRALQYYAMESPQSRKVCLTSETLFVPVFTVGHEENFPGRPLARARRTEPHQARRESHAGQHQSQKANSINQRLTND